MITLLAIMTMVVILQPTVERFRVATVYWAVIVGYASIGNQIDGPWYYLIGAGLDVVLIAVLGAVCTGSLMAIRLMIASSISIVFNAIGFFMWLMYMPPTIYNDSYVLLYGFAIFIMTLKDPADVGHYQRDSVWSRIRCHDFQSRHNVSRGNRPI